MCMNNIKADNKIFNVGSGKNYSIKSIYNEIRKILQSDIEPIFGKNFDFEAQDTLANIDLAKTIGWKPKTDLNTGLKKSIDYIREHVI